MTGWMLETRNMTDQITNEKLSQLLEAKESLATSGMDAATLLELTEQTLAVLEHHVERLTYLNALQAKETCEYFWEKAREGQEENKQYPRLGSRVRLIKNTLAIVWYHSSYLLKPKAGGKRVFTAKHISKPRHKFRYSNAALSNAYPWEKENVEDTENDYAKFRQRQSLITEIRSRLSRFKNITDAYSNNE